MMNAAINNNLKYYTAEKLITNKKTKKSNNMIRKIKTHFIIFFAQFMKNVATRSLNFA